MFAVSGWTVNADSLKQQTEQKEASKKRKRKRSKPSAGQNGPAGEQPAKAAVQSPTMPTENDRSVLGGRVKKNSSRKGSRSKPSVLRSVEHLAEDTGSSHRSLPNGNVSAEEQLKSNKSSISKTLDSNFENTSQSASQTKYTPLQSAMRSKLQGARFRHINELLYTNNSKKAEALFKENPSMFADYHTGFRSQVSSWPSNPVESFLQWLLERGKIRYKPHRRSQGDDADAPEPAGLEPLPRSDYVCTVADLGCGDAQLQERLEADPRKAKSLRIRVLSYDLVSNVDRVIPADISNLPLGEDSVNVAIFCLSLMGTNWIAFVEEAWRILRWKGELWVAEIKSRFPRKSSVASRSSTSPPPAAKGKSKQKAQKGGKQRTTERSVDVVHDEAGFEEPDDSPAQQETTDVRPFIDVLERRGFKLCNNDSVDLQNKMFVLMRFRKIATPTAGKYASSTRQSGQGLQRPTFLPTNSGPSEEEEIKVLKPCLYKTR